ncbi:hypothetical protein Tco_0533572 [Tanacetum coccineum]
MLVDDHPVKSFNLSQRSRDHFPSNKSKPKIGASLCLSHSSANHISRIVSSSASKSNSLRINLDLVRRVLPRDFLLVPEDVGEETPGGWGTSRQELDWGAFSRLLLLDVLVCRASQVFSDVFDLSVFV